MTKATKSKRARCTCLAYPFPHRPGGGLCRHPDPPVRAFAGPAGKNAPVGMRRRSAIRRLLIRKQAAGGPGWRRS